VCVRLGKLEFLFDKVWNTFSEDPFSCAAFLESLEPYILSDQLPVIPTIIIQRFVEHYEKREKFGALEACITHLSVMCLDIHQIMVICEKHELYDAIIYIYNNAMLDYISPAEQLLKQVREAISSSQPLTQEQINVGNKLLVYVSGCLAGRAYPFGDVPKDRVKQVKYDIYSTITLIHCRKISPESEHEPPYPHLHTLLAFDTQGFLNVLSIAFEEEEYQTEIGASQKQRLVDLLLQVMLKEDSNFSPAQVGNLFTFLARQIAKGDSSVNISRDLFSKVLTVLTDPEQPGSREEREDSLLDMLEFGGWNLFDENYLETSCQAIGFYRVLRKVYLGQQQYVKLYHSYIKDERRNIQTFNFIQSLFSDGRYSETVKEEIREEIIKTIKDLVNIDLKKTTSITLQFLSQRIPDILQILESEPVYYEFLQELLELRGTGEALGSPVHQATIKQVFTVQLYEQYIELMCVKEPTSVREYVKTKETFRPEVVLDLCEKYNIVDARVYILETMDRHKEAFNILSAILTDKTAQCVDETERKELRIAELNTQLVVVTQFLQRCSEKLTEESREELWCKVLDIISHPLSTVADAEPWRAMVRHIVSTMLGHVGHKKVVSLVLSHPSCSSGLDTWQHLKHMLTELIETFRYEERVLESSIQVQEKERALLIRELVLTKKRALQSYGRRCTVCNLNLIVHPRSVVFDCGCAAHVDCADKCGGATYDIVGNEVWACTSCHPHLHTTQQGRRVTITGATTTSNVPVIDSNLKTALSVWTKMNKTVDYAEAGNFEAEENDFGGNDYIEGEVGHNFLNSDKFKLRLRPDASNNVD